MNLLTYKDGSVIFCEGDLEDWMFDIFSGSVDIYISYGTPEAKKLATLGHGELFGEMGLIEKKPRSATAVAVGEVRVKQISEEDLLTYIQEEPTKALRVMQQTSMRTRSLSKEYVKATNVISDYLKAEEAGEKVPSDTMDAMKELLKKTK